MDIKEIEKRMLPLVRMTVRILKAITNGLNYPDTNCFYRLLLEDPEIDQYIEKEDE